MTTAHEALRQCVEVLKLVDFADCAEKPELWHKLNAAQQVAEEVLKRPEQSEIWHVQKLRDAAADPMWYERAEVSKSLLIGAANIIEAASARIVKLKAEAATVAAQKAVAAVPSDWQLVPKKPTAQMILAAEKADDEGFEAGRSHGASPYEIYDAMLATAPQPAAAPSGDVERDAARYRWLLNHYAFGDGYKDIDAALNDGEADKYLSHAIDAAINATKE